MIVDDKEYVRRELKRMKIWGDSLGFEICNEEKNGEDALEYLKENTIDLIITDIKMPKVDGIELLREVVAQKLCSCVVLISDYSEFSYARQGIILGAFDYLPKPVRESDFEYLLQRAKNYLDQYNLEKERVRNLEKIEYENSDVIFLRNNLEKLANLIMSGDTNIYDLIDHIFSHIWDHYSDDFNEFMNIFDNALIELKSEFKKTYIWLEKYYDSSHWQGDQYRSGATEEYMKYMFTNRVGEMVTLFHILQCTGNQKGVIGEIVNFVLNHVEEDISLTSVAKNLYLNKTYLSELFKQKTGVSFTEYVTNVKMERAKVILVQQNLKTYEVAELLGFKDSEYFSKVFKKCIGSTPTLYRRKM